MSWFIFTQNLGMGAGGQIVPPAFQYFEQALVAELQSIYELVEIVGNAIYVAAVPQTWDFGRNGPALTFIVPTKDRGHVLTGSDGTATARVQIDMWGYSEAAVKTGIEAVRNGIDGTPGTWGDGTCQIISVVQQEDTDMDEPPKAGSDQVLYRTMSEYVVRYRVSIPTLS